MNNPCFVKSGPTEKAIVWSILLSFGSGFFWYSWAICGQQIPRDALGVSRFWDSLFLVPFPWIVLLLGRGWNVSTPNKPHPILLGLLSGLGIGLVTTPFFFFWESAFMALLTQAAITVVSVVMFGVKYLLTKLWKA